MKKSDQIIELAVPLLSLMLLFASSTLASERPDFSGTWKLNKELSEDPREQMRESKGNRGGGGFSGGGRSGGGGSRGARSGSRGGSSQERAQSMGVRMETLRITHQDPDLEIRFADGSERMITTDGRAIEDDFEGGTFDASAKWKKDTQLVFKAISSRGGKMTEIYELSESGEQLYVTTKTESDGRMPNLSFRRVYEPASTFEQALENDSEDS